MNEQQQDSPQKDSLLSRTNRAIDKWLDTGTPSTRNIKLIGVFSLAAACISGALLCATHDERQDKEAIINALNTQETIIFNSHQDCVTKGFDTLSCATSQENAIDLASQFRTPVKATDFQSCIDTYGTCPDRVSAYSAGYKIDLYRYKPVLSSWQAVKSDISQSAALYKGAQQGQYLRIDGTTL
jgi:uncharacterized protein YgiB involved in biofilm formation